MPTRERRFTDSGQTIYDLMTEILVVCPKCQACALILETEPDNKSLFAPRRLTCAQCGLTQSWAKHRIRRGWSDQPVTDDFFHHPLWLQITFGRNILWAYNYQHLDLIERYVGAKLRERPKPPHAGAASASLINHLPQWIKSAKNRAAILKTIGKLKADSFRK